HRLLELPDEVLVLPAHGAGSACGKALSTETVSTIGEQRRTNYALAPMGEDEFVAIVTEDQPAAPEYFVAAAVGNRKDRELLDEQAAVPSLDLAALDAATADGAVVVDVRPVEDVAGGHLAGAVAVGLGGRFAEQVGSVVPVGAPIVLVGPPEAAHEATIRLARIGFDDVVGNLPEVEAVLAAHPQRSARLSRLSATELEERRGALGDELQLVDVRNPGEVTAAPVEGAVNIPLAHLRSRRDELDPARPVVLVCAGGARSAIAASVLLADGFGDVSDVLGGATAMGIGEACTLSQPEQG
ncbi:MAG TPA: rhodanese-like domain-containing protein, partial [Aquihabitans sp.]|nr:rhodanese-like domain-containing protein [Aquihabitans sp.]